MSARWRRCGRRLISHERRRSAEPTPPNQNSPLPKTPSPMPSFALKRRGGSVLCATLLHTVLHCSTLFGSVQFQSTLLRSVLFVHSGICAPLFFYFFFHALTILCSGSDRDRITSE